MVPQTDAFGTENRSCLQKSSEDPIVVFERRNCAVQILLLKTCGTGSESIDPRVWPARMGGAPLVSALPSFHEAFARICTRIHFGGTARGDRRDRPIGGDVASGLGLCEGESWIHPLPSQLEAIGIGLSDLCTRSPGCPPPPISLGDHQYLVSIIGYRPRIAIFNISLPNISTPFLDQLAADVRCLGRSSRGPPERPSSGIPPE